MRLHRSATLWVACTLLLALSPAAQAQSTSRCFIAFIHGAGVDTTNYQGYWDWDVTERENRLWGGARRCTVYQVDYDGNAHFNSAETLASVTQKLQGFIQANGIKTRELILVAHSMGGLVARFIINNGEAQAPYYREEYRQVKDATRYLVTLGTPHLGSTIADLAEVAALVPNLQPALIFYNFKFTLWYSQLMSRVLVPASVPGGWMGDIGRTRPIYTAAATGKDWIHNDGEMWLQLVWNLARPLVPGDGLVSEYSAAGQFSTCAVACWATAYMPGAREDWLRTTFPHNGLGRGNYAGGIRNLAEDQYVTATLSDFFYADPTGTGTYLYNLDRYMPRQGGQGGWPFRLECGAGAAVVGLFGRTGTQVDALGLICRRTSDGAEWRVGTVGGGGGWYFEDRCPAGQGVYALTGRGGFLMDRIGAVCRSLTPTYLPPGPWSSTGITFYNYTTLPEHGGGGGNPFRTECAKPRSVLNGVRGRSGGLVDSLQGFCL